MPDNIINLVDRVKELSYTMGTGNLVLSGPISGFSSFNSAYANHDNLFYAITDGSSYEVGSGVYIDDVQDELVRFPFKSSNNNLLVDFPEGTKEVYVTYPATHSVYSASGVANFVSPRSSGVAFWISPNVLNYDANLVWDNANTRLGINQPNPQYAIDIGGEAKNSILYVSGIIVGSSGIRYLNDPQGGAQTAHYQKNQLDQYAYDESLIGQLTGSDAVLELSGVANQYILFKQQNAGSVFAGPVSGCSPPCSPAYPSFRILSYEDIPAIGVVSGILNDKIFTLNTKIGTASGIATTASGVATTASDIATAASGIATTASGILRNDITTVSGIATTALSNVLSSTIIINNTANGRLTLETGIPVSTTGVVGSTIYYTPYNGSQIGLYDGIKWNMVNFTEKSLSVGTKIADTNYDIFGYSVSGVLNLEFGPAWSTNTARSIDIVKQDGIYCKTGTLTKRYLGTVRTNTTTTLIDSSAYRYVWNMDNRVSRKLYSTIISPPSWSYSSATWRVLSGTLMTSVNIINGVAQNSVTLTAGLLVTISAKITPISYYFLGISQSSTGSPSPLAGLITGTRLGEDVVSTKHIQLFVSTVNQPLAGYTSYYPVEQAFGPYTGWTLYGDDTGSQFGGIYGTWEC